MSYILLVVIIAALLFWWHWNSSEDSAERRRLLQNAITWALLVAIVLLAATGRIHWLGAVFASAFLLIKHLGIMLLKYFPILRKIYATRSQQQPQAQTSNMSIREACEILGVEEGADKETIRRAHRQQMQKIHPDHGGNPYFAAKLNQARDLLLGKSRRV